MARRAHDLDAILLDVLKRFAPFTATRIHIDWVDLDEVDRALFDADSDWGCVTGKREAMCIGLNPELKRAPRYVVSFLVFHELLHLAIPPHAGRTHTSAFRVAERLWPDYHRATKWLGEHA